MTKYLISAIVVGLLTACTPNKPAEASSNTTKVKTTTTTKKTTVVKRTVYVSKPTVVKRTVVPTKSYTSYSAPTKRVSSYVEYDYYDLKDCSLTTRGFKSVYKCIDRD